MADPIITGLVEGLHSGAAGVAAWNKYWKEHSANPRPPMRDVQWEGLDLQGIDLRKCDMPFANLRGANLEKAVLTGADLTEAELDGANLFLAELRDVKLGLASLRNVDATGARLSGGDLTNADLRGSNFSGARLDGVSADSADFRGCKADGGTVVTVESAYRARIDRYLLEAWREQAGWNTTAQQMDLRIEDGVAALRQSFGGFWSWIHALALVVFAAPYIGFITWHGFFSEGVRGTGDGWTTLRHAFLHFVRTHGIAHTASAPTNYPYLTLFAGLLLYNSARLWLLWKTKQVELQEAATGLPVKFSLQDHAILLRWRLKLPRTPWLTWKGLYLFVHYGFYANLILVVINTWLFMSRWIRVPA